MFIPDLRKFKSFYLLSLAQANFGMMAPSAGSVNTVLHPPQLSVEQEAPKNLGQLLVIAPKQTSNGQNSGDSSDGQAARTSF